MSNCKKCGSEVQSNFCPNCGHPEKLPRINGRYILTEVGSVLNFQKGFFYTIRELLIRPGQSIRTFIAEDRKRLVKPIMFILICSLIYTLFVRLFHFEDGYMNFSADEGQVTATGTILQWITNNYGYSNILIAIFISLWIKVFYRRYSYNFYEILILLCFVMGIEMLAFSVFGIIEGITKVKILNYGFVAVLIYAFWAIGQFFDKKKILNYVKAFICSFLGMISFYVLAIGIGIFIDVMR